MGTKRRAYSPEYRDEAVRMVIDSSRPIAEVARDLGLNEGTLGNWVNKYRHEHAGEEPPATVDGVRTRPAARAGKGSRRAAHGTRVPKKGAPRTREVVLR